MRKLLLVALGALMLVAFRPEPGHADTVAVVTVDLNVRGGPGVGYHALMVIPAGAPVDVLGCSLGWCEIAYDGIIGYVSERYLSFGAYAYAPPVYVPAPIYRSYPYTYRHHRTYRSHRSYRPRVVQPRRVERPRVRAHRPAISQPRRARRTQESRRSTPRFHRERSARRDGRGTRNRGRVQRQERSRSWRGSQEQYRGRSRNRSDLFGPVLPNVAPASYAAYVGDVRIMTI